MSLPSEFRIPDGLAQLVAILAQWCWGVKRAVQHIVHWKTAKPSCMSVVCLQKDVMDNNKRETLFSTAVIRTGLLN